ncbi:MAG: alpha/beta fold hydrolase [Bradyrhizobiaceae bacterium]|nr:alpha/beta fold hydrolase [Bradyrhizobiaceae bacterium]
MAVTKIKVRDGVEIACEARGYVKASPPLVLVHSLAMDHTFWDAVASPLAGTTTVLTYDCRGHGLSGKPEGSYFIEQFADDLADLIDRFDWREVVVAGASMGGCVALAFAAAYPDRAAGLGLFDTTAGYDAADKWEERALTAEAHGLEAMVEFQTTRWFSDAFRESRKDVVDAAVAVFLANEARCYAQACRMLGRFDIAHALSRLEMPARIVVGEEDYATPVAMSEALHRGIARSSLLVIPGARHLTPLECPNRIAAELQALLVTVSA